MKYTVCRCIGIDMDNILGTIALDMHKVLVHTNVHLHAACTVIIKADFWY